MYKKIDKEMERLTAGVFKPPVKIYYWGELSFGTPYFWPINFCQSIISIRKLKLSPKEELDKCINDYQKANKKFVNMPLVRRTKNWTIKLFGQYFYVALGWPIMFAKTNLGWKDKWETPRFEWSPSFLIFFFKWQFCIHWKAPIEDEDRYWEMLLWYNEYADKDIIKAKETWPWKNYETKESTWDNECLIKKLRFC